MIRKNRSPLPKETKVAMKYILAKLKYVICDNYGKPSYAESFDGVIEDIFGVKNLYKKLNTSYDDRNILMALDEVGIKNFVNIVDNERMYAKFQELVVLYDDLRKIQKKYKKLSRGGKSMDKSLAKEYKWKSRLYKNVIEVFQRVLGVQTKKKSYKNRYSSLVEFSDYDEYDDYSIFDSFESFDDDEDDEDPEIYYESGLQNILSQMRGESRSNRGRNVQSNRGRGRYSNLSDDLEDYEDDSTFDEDDDDDDDYTPTPKRSFTKKSNVDKKLERLEGLISDIGQQVQYMSNVNNYSNPTVAPNQPIQHTPSGNESNLEKSISTLSSAMTVLIKKSNAVMDSQAALAEAIGMFAESKFSNVEHEENFDDAEDDVEETFAGSHAMMGLPEEFYMQQETPQQPKRYQEMVIAENVTINHCEPVADDDEEELQESSELENVINKYEDPFMEEMNQQSIVQSVKNARRQELIDSINHPHKMQ